MIKIYVGNVGSGKTAHAVMDMARFNRNTYSNINTFNLKNCHVISPANIINREILGYKKNRLTGISEPVYKQSLNIEFWKKVNKPCDVVLDECHNILNSRRSMTNTNRIISEWLSMLRRVLNESDEKTGHLILISQRYMLIDENARNLATQICHHIDHYLKTCQNCTFRFEEDSQNPEPSEYCPNCGSDSMKKSGHQIEVLKFEDEEAYLSWKIDKNENAAYDNYYIKNISKYFKNYNTLQWDNMFSGYY